MMVAPPIPAAVPQHTSTSVKLAITSQERCSPARMPSARAAPTKFRRVLVMAEPPSVDGHEIIDSGYINRRATRERRRAPVDKLYAGGEGVMEIA